MNLHILGRKVLEDLSLVDDNFLIDYTEVKKWAGVKNDIWTKETEEKFARGFEKYIIEGIAPTSALLNVFSYLKECMLNIYHSIKNKKINIELNDNVRKAYDNLLNGNSKPRPNGIKT
ncbi:MAG: hypothetical protein HC831_20450 [Chloroflexia bacterium]|nr:hypothetical protein [Chloroflexia bacterium]